MDYNSYTQQIEAINTQLQAIADLTAAQSLSGTADESNPAFVSAMRAHKRLVTLSAKLTVRFSQRQTPNPGSKLLQHAIIGGGGIRMPAETEAPDGMAVILLYVPIELMAGKTLPQIQSDIGLPWANQDGEPVWMDR